MNRISVLGVVALAGGLAVPTFGHGGTYRGPGDTVPPPGGVPGGGAAPPPPPSPGGGPATPGPPTPGAPAPTTPGQTPNTPTGTGPTTGAPADMGPELSVWDFWWGFNKEPYLNLRARVQDTGIISNSDEFFLGRGTEQKQQSTLRPTQDQIRNEVVPALKWVLENERQNDLITGALVALAKIGDVADADGKSEFVEIFTGWLKSPEQEISETAALALGILADDRSVPPLVSLMTDDKVGQSLVEKSAVPFRTRTFAAYGLGLVGYRTASNEVRQVIGEHLIDFLQSPDQAQEDMKVGALQALGLIPFDWAGEAPAEEDSNAKYVANRVEVLKYLSMKMNPTRTGPEGGFKDHRVRAQTPIAVARLITRDGTYPTEFEDIRQELVDQLIDLSGNRQEPVEIRQSSTIALGMIGDAGKTDVNKSIWKTLEKIADSSPDPQTEYFAVMAIAQMGGRKGTGDAPREYQDEAEEFLLKSLARGKGQKAPWAGLALGVFGYALGESDGTVSPEVKSALRDKFDKKVSSYERGAYAVALGLLKDKAAEEMLVETLEKLGTSQDDVRGYICVGLGLMQATTANDLLNDLVKSSKFRPELLKQAAIGLGLLGDKAAVSTLVEMLKDAKGLASQAAIATALGTIGDTNAVSELVKMARGETQEQMTDLARGFACAALGITCDKELFPWNTKIAVNTNYRANVRTLTSPTDGDGILDIL